MHRSTRTFARSVLVATWIATATLSTVHATPPSDEELAAAMDRFLTPYRDANARSNLGALGSPEEIHALADKVFEHIEVAELTFDQLDRVLSSEVAMWSSKRQQFNEALERFSAQQDAQGAKALSRLVDRKINRVDDPRERLNLVRTAMRHPGYRAALREGDRFASWMLSRYSHVVDEKTPPDLLHEALTELIEQTDLVIADDLPAQATASFDVIIRLLIDYGGAAFADRTQRLRAGMLAGIDRALAKVSDEEDRERLESLKGFLQGPYARGQLLGKEAPDLDFIWTSGAAGPASRRDLRGKVVVVDFWASWCAPCLQSIPDMNELQEYYKGFDVAILGVTSVQGQVIRPKAPKGTPTVVKTEGNPEQEFEQLAAFAQDYAINWTIAVSRQPMENPDYGVTGPPHMVVIDSAGVLRHRGLHPSFAVTSKKQKIHKINQLLHEAGLRAPPELD